ncbi:hypothetical protein ABEB36_003627 [Hypothenemus hampei]|uniref:Peptidase A2 domain-containing protein n=1 Tax=Hypothenemus hampei TaxID=57062 RepID=A0ABD1F9S1_HYPHA
MASANTTVGDALRQVIDPAAPKFVQPPIFRPASDSPSSFLLGYERAAIGNGWSDNYKILYLGQFLEEPAHKLYQKYLANDENSGNNWETINKDLKAKFMEGQQQELISNSFYHKKQGYAEDIKHYYYELQGLADEVNLNMPFADFLAQFEKGLHPKFRQIYYILKDNDTNHEILKNIVQKLQRSQESPLPKRLRTTSISSPQEVVLQTSGSNILSIKGIINDKYIDIVLDTGAGRSIIRKNIATKIDKIHSNIDIIGAGGIRIPIIGKNIGKIELGNVKIYTPLLIANHLSRPVILGNDFLQRTGAIINYRDNTISLEFGGNRIQLKFTDTSSTSPLGTISPDTTHQQEIVKKSQKTPDESIFNINMKKPNTEGHDSRIKIQCPSDYTLQPNRSIEIRFPNIKTSQTKRENLVVHDNTKFLSPRTISLGIPKSKNGTLSMDIRSRKHVKIFKTRERDYNRLP